MYSRKNMYVLPSHKNLCWTVPDHTSSSIDEMHPPICLHSYVLLWQAVLLNEFHSFGGIRIVTYAILKQLDLQALSAPGWWPHKQAYPFEVKRKILNHRCHWKQTESIHIVCWIPFVHHHVDFQLNHQDFRQLTALLRIFVPHRLSSHMSCYSFGKWLEFHFSQFHDKGMHNNVWTCNISDLTIIFWEISLLFTLLLLLLLLSYSRMMVSCLSCGAKPSVFYNLLLN
jgi:hypothetical protein